MNSQQEQILIARTAELENALSERLLELQHKNRELEIEAALERVRSRSMAMHQSTELTEVADVLFQQLRSLGGNLWACGFVLCKPGAQDDEVWFANENGVLPPVTIPNTKDPTHNKMYEGWKNKMDLFTESLEGSALKAHYDYMLSLTSVNALFENILASGLSFPTSQTWHAAYFKYGYVLTITLEAYPDEQVFIRFAKVFEQTYTRFLDLQKAEAQAREAQIEVALEKVRAGAMAMHHSGEIPEVAHIIWQQLAELKLADFDGCAILVLDEEGTNTYDSWYAFPETVQGDQHVMGVTKYAQDCAWVIKEMFAKYRSGESEIIVEMNPEQINEFLDWVELDNPALTKEIRGMNLQQLFLYAFPYSNGVVTSYAFKNLRKETSAVLKRITGVFDMAYRRFRDLQKAEAQAREAQIELGLERVRARAMAMQKSEELSVLIATVYSELVKLEVVFNRCFIMIFDNTGGVTWWMASHEAPEIQKGFYVKYHEHTPHLAYLQGWKMRQKKWEHIFEGDVKKNWDNFLFSETELATLPGFVIEGMKSVHRVNLSASFNNFGCLTTGSIDPLTNEAFDILLRFAKVFDSTYTRFNDLQKAEAQAREAEIELALERVRARTMAMQHSNELREAANLLFQQVQTLGIPVWTCGYNIWEKGEQFCTGWMSTLGNLQPSFRIPFTYGHTFMHMNESRLKGEPFYVEEMGGEALAEHYRNMFSLPDFKAIVNEQLKDGFTLPTFQINYVFNFRHGNLIFISGEAIPEALGIFKRFTAVFEQTYTRFLDLQKVEAQAREAQIEVALEKVRSRSLAMHRSDELTEVMSVMFEKMTDLNVLLGTIAIQLFDEKTKSCDFWIDNKLQNPALVNLPYDEKIMKEDAYMQACWKAKASGESIINKVETPEKINKYFDYVFANNDEKAIPIPVREFIRQANQHVYCLIIEKNSALFADCWTGQLMLKNKLLF